MEGKLIYETENFYVRTPLYIQVSREDGGHVVVSPKKPESLTDLTKVPPKLAVEAQRLTMMASEALEATIKNSGMKFARINFEVVGNYDIFLGKEPKYHVHIFGRTWDSVNHPFPMPIKHVERTTGFYDKFEPLTDEEVSLMKSEMERLEKEDRYKVENWKL